MKLLILILAFLFTSSLCFADDAIQGHYCYTYGDRESLQEARELTRFLAIRNAIESYRTFIISTSHVKNFQLTNDLVQMISSGYLKDIKVIEHKEEGRTVCETIMAMISPQAVENIIRQAKGQIEKVEEKGVANNGYLKILNITETKFPESKPWPARRRLSVIVKYLKETKDVKFRSVLVDFYDSQGLPIGGTQGHIAGPGYDDSPIEGAIRAIDFSIPDIASYKVWLYREK